MLLYISSYFIVYLFSMFCSHFQLISSLSLLFISCFSSSPFLYRWILSTIYEHLSFIRLEIFSPHLHPFPLVSSSSDSTHLYFYIFIHSILFSFTLLYPSFICLFTFSYFSFLQGIVPLPNTKNHCQLHSEIASHCYIIVNISLILYFTFHLLAILFYFTLFRYSHFSSFQ